MAALKLAALELFIQPHRSESMHVAKIAIKSRTTRKFMSTTDAAATWRALHACALPPVRCRFHVFPELATSLSVWRLAQLLS
jgi:hypothetical protein